MNAIRVPARLNRQFNYVVKQRATGDDLIMNMASGHCDAVEAMTSAKLPKHSG